ncbi:MAG TPA: cytochrome bc complex cytochrome b subunit [Thermoplasmata archaeon]|nr:cytochrome bc complex cytochrome b subunit [Thermoplasmata archaeon]
MGKSAGTPTSPPTPKRGPLASLYNRGLNTVWDFLESRTHISKWPYRPQPEFSFNPSYWTGAFVAVGFILQVLTGLLLLFYYDPSAAAATTGAPPQAWASTQYIIQTVPFGWLLLSSHLYGAYAVIMLGFVHFFRGFYTGAYKRPREVSWTLGALLLICMLGMGFTGYLLPYTALSVGATDVGLSLTSSVPIVGPILSPLLQGNGTYQGLLSRMFALHVVLIPVVLLALLYAHVTLFESHGIAPAASSDPKAKRVLTSADDKKLGSWFPRVFLYMLKWGFVYVGFLLLIASSFLVALPAAFGAQNQGGASPEPDWYFLWLYKVADFQYVTPVIAVVLVTLLALFILLVPWIEGILGHLLPRLKNLRTHPRDRPVVLFTATFLLGFFALLTVWGGVMPGTPIPVQMYVAYLGALALLDALVILVFYLRYQRSYRARLAAAKQTPRDPPSIPSANALPVPKRAAESGRIPFWDGSMALMAITLAGLLIPLFFVLDQQSYVGAANERAFGVATAIMAFAVAGMVHVLERNLFRRQAASRT